MKPTLSRRDLLQSLGISGLALGLGMVPGRAFGQTAASEHSGSWAGHFKDIPPTAAHAPALFQDGKVLQPARELAVLHQTDVLVVGGGPAGFVAALAARRAGARVALAERYGYCGGLWTGGLVLVVLGTHVKGENGQLKKVVRGIADECFERLRKLDPGIINQEEGKFNPTPDPEATKVVIDEMLREAGVDVFYHCWGADAIMAGKTVQGAIFESKEGRKAILAKVVIDATGDGDIFASAGVGYEQIAHRIGLNCRLGNVDRVDPTKAGGKKINLGAVEPNPSTRWVNMAGPDADCLSVADLTRLEMEHRGMIWKRVQEIRKTPGYEQVYLLQTAPQLGVRISRLLDGMQKITWDDYRAGRMHPEIVAMGGAAQLSRTQKRWSIPYGSLLPREVDGLLVAGRCVCCDRKMLEVMRLIPACMTMGQAAGAAAALAVKAGTRPREVEVAGLQQLLREQGAYLG